VTHPATRNTLLVESGVVILNEAHPGDQYFMRLRAPRIAQRALPGQFVHLRCDPGLPMRRPMSIMQVHGDGTLDILYKVHGLGTRLLAKRRPDDEVSLIGPIGVPFRLEGYRRRPLLLGGGVGIPPMVFLADHMRRLRDVAPFVIMGSEVPFPFPARPSRIIVDGLPDGVIATMPLLDDWGVACRLASLQGYPGCHEGYVTDLARRWLDALGPGGQAEVEMFACGPTPMLKAVAALAREYGLPCQVSVEEYMACAVGGCAGCAVPVVTPEGRAMKRVCVDGPVFDAQAVFPA
jgi:dihydroorotate dehydrogenase electron transfer subunit